MNFIFISPNFPKTYCNFTMALKNKGVTTLGIGDEAYELMDENCKNSLVEYYKVNSLENYDEVYRAVGYFIHKYGRIDWLESNNEYWLLQDARLRTDFNITTGVQSNRIDGIKYKSKMKAYYKKAGVPTARYHLVTTLARACHFIEKVGYPVVVKPDNGVGAYATYRINNERELTDFYQNLPQVPYIMEEYIDGTIVSYDGVADSHHHILFETSHVFPNPIMNLVNDQLDMLYYSVREIPEDLKTMGRKVIKTFEAQSRFFHCEFFRLNADKKGLGKKNDLIGLEVNMRPPGGYTPDMMNFANEMNVYQVYADMVTEDKACHFDPSHRPYYCVYTGRRNQHQYVLSLEEIKEKYKDKIKMIEEMPEIFTSAMGNLAIMAIFETEDEVNAFAFDVLKQRG